MLAGSSNCLPMSTPTCELQASNNNLSPTTTKKRRQFLVGWRKATRVGIKSTLLEFGGGLTYYPLRYKEGFDLHASDLRIEKPGSDIPMVLLRREEGWPFTVSIENDQKQWVGPSGGRTYITIATKNRASMQKWFQIITEAAKPAEVSPKVDRKTGGKKVKNLADFRQTSFSELRSSSGLSSSRKLIFRGEDPMSVKYMSDGEEDDYFGGDSSELERYADETEEFCDENMGEGEAEEMEPGLWGGFLWIKKNNSSYKKYYCLANSHYFEIFFYTVGIPIHTSDIKDIRTKTLKERRLATYLDPHRTLLVSKLLSMLSLRVYRYKLKFINSNNKSAFSCVTSSEENRNAIKACAEALLSQNPTSGSESSRSDVENPSSDNDSSLWRDDVTETDSTTVLRNRVRQLVEKGRREAGKTDFGDYATDVKPVSDGHLRILSLDGGGLRAIIQVVLLIRIMERYPDFFQRVDVFAGVSGGSIVAAFLATGKSPKLVFEIWLELAPRLFDSSRGRSLGGISIMQAKYSHDMLLVTASEIWRRMKLCDVPKYFIATSLLLDNELRGHRRSWVPKVYHNLPERKKNLLAEISGGDTDDDDDDFWYDSEELSEDEKQSFLSEDDKQTPIADIIMGSGAAPTFFPGHNGHIDGGVFSNDPTIAAVSTVMSPHLVTPTKEPRKIHVLSIGTGRKLQYIESDSLDWGIFQWGSKNTSGTWGGLKLSEVLKETAGLHSQHCTRRLLHRNYHKLNPPLDRYYPLDEADELPALIKIAQEYDLTDTFHWIDVHFYGKKSRTNNLTGSMDKMRETAEREREKELEEKEKQQRERDTEKETEKPTEKLTFRSFYPKIGRERSRKEDSSEQKLQQDRKESDEKRRRIFKKPAKVLGNSIKGATRGGETIVTKQPQPQQQQMTAPTEEEEAYQSMMRSGTISFYEQLRVGVTKMQKVPRGTNEDEDDDEEEDEDDGSSEEKVNPADIILCQSSDSCPLTRA